ncbi:uncharacterized protein Duba [Eurosta solidaginis]|uniref:uncharacterized protein Duba n=1 Tax=Eurosta solidaginis TaxID=178769 RepID=UPI00353078AC
MTIKPVIAPAQKRISSDDKKESHNHPHGHVLVHGHNVGDQASAHGQTSGRTTGSHVLARGGQSPQRRVDGFEELTRHRRSPHKSSRSKRRDHHDHHKRDRTEREKRVTGIIPTGTISNKCNSPLAHCGVPAATALTNNVISSPSSGKSPVHVSGSGGNSPDHLSGIPVVLGCQSPKSSSSVAQVAANLLKAVEEAYSGYNSGDEHLYPKEAAITADEWRQRDAQFEKCMAQRGYELRPVEEDGACLFRSISLQIYGDEEMHDIVRQHTMDYLYKNRDYFSQFVTEDINSYIKRKRRKDAHGNHIEIQAISEIYNRPVEVYSYKPTPINIFNSEQMNKGYAPLRLSYQHGSHYNAIIDPYEPTVGVGLGLAGYKPELPTKEAMVLSEQMEIEQTMFEDKLKTTDWEATNEAIEEQIARESYLQWCRENLQKKRATAATSSATVTSAEVASDSEASPSKYSCGGINVTQPDVGGSSTHTATTSNNIYDHNLSGEAGTAELFNKNASTSSAMIGLSPKSLSGFAHNLRKNNTPPHSSADWEHDSDDTDMSSTSSTGANNGNNSIGSLKSKKRNTNVRTSGKKRRREPKLGEAKSDVQNIAKSPKYEGGSPLLRSKSRPHTPEGDQQPCTSKKSNTSSPEENLGKMADNFVDTLSASTSKRNLPSLLSSPEKPTSSINKVETSNFYQDLLEASYAADGFGQLSESEMLQRAIQLSTQDYIEDQKRKYLFGP